MQHHSFACEFFKRQEGPSWSSGLRVSDAVRRHGFTGQFLFGEGFKTPMEAVGNSLAAFKPARTEQFSRYAFEIAHKKT
jgi:hypothetical protein